jgi:hypothetical protein
LKWDYREVVTKEEARRYWEIVPGCSKRYGKFCLRGEILVTAFERDGDVLEFASDIASLTGRFVGFIPNPPDFWQIDSFITLVQLAALREGETVVLAAFFKLWGVLFNGLVG